MSYRTSAVEHDHSQPKRELAVVKKPPTLCKDCRWMSWNGFPGHPNLWKCRAPVDGVVSYQTGALVYDDDRYCKVHNKEGKCGDFESRGYGFWGWLWRWFVRGNR